MKLTNVPAALFLTLIAGSTQSLASEPLPASYELSALDGTNGFVLNGIDAGDASGVSVSGAGDVNGDGINDLIIGAFLADRNGSRSGESYVVFGGVGIGNDGSFELSSLNGTNGFVVNGISEGDFSGVAVSDTGDVNGDEIDDLIISSWRARPSGIDSGQCYVVFGGKGVGAGGLIELSSLDGTNGFALNGIDPYDRSGLSSSGAGDVNGDGFNDVIIGANEAGPNGPISGESYVVFGGNTVVTGGVLELSSLDGTNGFVLTGIDAYDRSGRSVSDAGDFNGDGIDDIIIGANNASPNGLFSGESYVVFGSAGIGASGLLELSSLDGSDGFVLNGINEGDRSGRSVSGAGDVNGDGIDDVIIGASFADPNGVASGESYVIFGGEGVGAGGSIELSALNGSNGFVLNGIAFGDQSALPVSDVGDVNGDGFGDIIIGARYDNVVRGESYIVLGGTNVGASGSLELDELNGANGFVLKGIDAFDESGYSASGTGDINGDGIDDIIIGASDADPNGDRSGESYVVFGSVRIQPSPADINCDGAINSVDLEIFLAAWGMPGADFNNDGTTDSTDLAILLAAWTG